MPPVYHYCLFAEVSIGAILEAMIGVHRGIAKHIQLVRVWKRISIGIVCLIGLACVGGLAGAMQSQHDEQPVSPAPGASGSQQKSQTGSTGQSQGEVEGAATDTASTPTPQSTAAPIVPSPKKSYPTSTSPPVTESPAPSQPESPQQPSEPTDPVEPTTPPDNTPPEEPVVPPENTNPE
jgi:outer membrane biosynthesis protein TonB